MSKEQKAKLRAEYIGLGGAGECSLEEASLEPAHFVLAENKAMPSNLFLNICIVMSAFAIVGKAMGMY